MLRRTLLIAFPLCPALRSQSNLTGTYKGKWTGMSASGDFLLKLEQPSADWKATVVFTLGEASIPTTVKSLRVEGSRIDVRYEFDLAGNKLESHLEGEVRDGMLTGTYKTRAVADGSAVDEGTCEAKRTQ